MNKIQKSLLFLLIIPPFFKLSLAENSVASSTPSKQIFSPSTFHDNLADGSPGLELIKIVAGQFQMGDLQQNGKSYELPVHQVNISRSFNISRYPVTFAQYDKFTTATNRDPVGDFAWGRGDRPVLNVNVEDARAYATWLSQQTGQKYRLPSEAEWEYATRAGTTTAYPWGDEVGNNNANCKDCIAGRFLKMTTPVGQFPANAWGLHDMIGNLWEMTDDCWNDDYDNAPNDGSVWRSGDCTRTVLRGGSWGDTAADLRSSTRLRSYAGTRTIVIGFRLVREISE